MVSIAIFIYAATSPVNGYFGGSLYARMGGECSVFGLLVWKKEWKCFLGTVECLLCSIFSFPFFFTLSPVFPLKWTSGFTVNPVSSLGEKTGIIKLY